MAAVAGGVAPALGAALVAWGLVAAAAGALAHAWVVVAAFAALTVIVLRWWPNASEPVSPRPAPLWSALLVRAGAATAVVVGLSATTSLLGPQLGGLLAAAPLVVLVLAPATHRDRGTVAVRALLHGVVRGSVVATTWTAALLVALGAAR